MPTRDLQDVPGEPEVVSSEAGTPESDEALDQEAPHITSLKQQAPRDLRVQKQLAVVAVVFVAAFVLLVYLPSMSTVSKLHERITSGSLQLESNLERGRSLPMLRTAAVRLENELSGLKPLPERPDPDEVIHQANDFALQLQLRGFKYEKLDSVVEGPLGTMPLRMSFEGNFENVYGFIRRCEELPRPVRVREMKIRQKPGTQGMPTPSGEVLVEMVLNVYYRAGAFAGA